MILLIISQAGQVRQINVCVTLDICGRYGIKAVLNEVTESMKTVRTK